ncbi:unnamed protein product [Dicrocoelium dendriticum]|nr:unnamed protein product [Dicrocoelium dendriticum]
MNGESSSRRAVWDQQTARLFAAAKQGQLKILRQYGESDPTYFDTVDPLGNSIAHWATRGGHVKVLRYLSAICPRTLSATNLCGKQPIHVGSIAGKFICVAFLAHTLAACEQPDAQGRTPLLLARFIVSEKELRQYLSHGTASSQKRKQRGKDEEVVTALKD